MDKDRPSSKETRVDPRRDLRAIPIGNGAPGRVDAVVEIPRESRVKYEFDPPTGLFRVSRALTSAMRYPFNYGFIPRTLAKDGDCLDILAMDCPPFQAGSLISLAVVGGLGLIDRGEEDPKILGRPTYLMSESSESSESEGREPADPDAAYLEIIRHFFLHYKELERKQVEVSGWINRENAVRIVRESHERYARQAKEAG